jgi:hypothetical protein
MTEPKETDRLFESGCYSEQPNPLPETLPAGTVGNGVTSTSEVQLKRSGNSEQYWANWSCATSKTWLPPDKIEWNTVKRQPSPPAESKPGRFKVGDRVTNTERLWFCPLDGDSYSRDAGTLGTVRAIESTGNPRIEWDSTPNPRGYVGWLASCSVAPAAQPIPESAKGLPGGTHSCARCGNCAAAEPCGLCPPCELVSAMKADPYNPTGFSKSGRELHDATIAQGMATRDADYREKVAALKKDLDRAMPKRRDVLGRELVPWVGWVSTRWAK